MPAVTTVLVVGGGIAGSALATLLSREGVSVEIVEVQRHWTALGSGITLMGNALRVLEQVGVWPEVRDSGAAIDSAGIRSLSGELLGEGKQPPTGGAHLPPVVGMTRPRLAEILAGAATRAGAKVRLGATVRGLRDDGCGVEVTFSDGDTGRYDLVVGADGIRSSVRALLGIHIAPQPTGLGIWRVPTRRPAGVERTNLCHEGPFYLAGYTPTSDTTLYTFMIEDLRARTSLSPEQQLETVRDLTSGYGGAWPEIRQDMTDPLRVNYTALESMLLPAPWHRGAVVLIGDAVHACPPTLAQGAAMGLEDAAVLTELLLAADRLDDDVLRAYCGRRYERVRAIVEGSVEIGQRMLDNAPADIPAVMQRIAPLVSQPA